MVRHKALLAAYPDRDRVRLFVVALGPGRFLLVRAATSGPVADDSPGANYIKPAAGRSGGKAEIVSYSQRDGEAAGAGARPPTARGTSGRDPRFPPPGFGR